MIAGLDTEELLPVEASGRGGEGRSLACSSGSRRSSSASTCPRPAAQLGTALALVATASDAEELLDVEGKELGAVEAFGGGEEELGALLRVEALVERLDVP